MVRRIYILLILAVMSITPALAAEAEFYISDTTGDYGTTVSVPIYVSSTPNIGAADITLTFDPSALTVTSVDAGVLTSGVLIITDDTIDPINGTISEEDNSTVWSNGALASNTTTRATVNISIISRYGVSGGDESIATVQFHVKGGYGDTSPLTLSTVGAYDIDDPIVNGTKTTGYAEISVTKASGVFTATGVITGDINVDKNVDYIDFGMLGASYGLSLGAAGYNAAADLNGDNTVDYIDFGMLGAHYGECV